jgi:DNA-binding PadR family transcriptional regulator
LADLKQYNPAVPQQTARILARFQISNFDSSVCLPSDRQKKLDILSRMSIYRNPTMTGRLQHDAWHHLPLSPASLHILLALAGENLHGYGIMLEVARQSEGRYKIGPGTLYDNLKKMMSQGLVEETSGPAPSCDPRRKYYRLRALGRAVLAEEVKRLEAVLREARSNLRELKPRRA